MGTTTRFRGGKVSDFEGGVRNFALVNGGFLPDSLRGSRNQALVHICDWYATFIALAGASESEIAEIDSARHVPPIDAVNVWPSLVSGSASPRSEVPLSFCNAVADCDTPSGIGDSALISGEWKIVNGTQGGLGIWQGKRFPNASSVPAADPGCPQGCLFNLLTDPYERVDVKAAHPKIFRALMDRLRWYGQNVYQTNFSVANTCTSASKAFETHHGFLSPRCRRTEINSSAFASLPAAFDLRTEYLPSKYALSLGPEAPRFSWKVPLLEGEENRGVDQSAYRLVVRTGVENGIRCGTREWSNLMRVLLCRSEGIPIHYSLILPTLGQYSCGIQKSAALPFISQVSSPSSFDIGLSAPEDWGGADWIGGESHRLIRVFVPSSSKIVRARVHIAAPGCSVLSINGVQHTHSTSGICPWTNFNKTIYYSSYDALPYLVTGGHGNVFGFKLGHGMYTRYEEGTAMKVKITLDTESGCHVCSSGSTKSCSWYGIAGPFCLTILLKGQRSIGTDFLKNGTQCF